MSYSANGSTVRWPTTATTDVVGQVVSIGNSSSGAKIDITNLSSAKHLYETGLPDNEFTIEINGENSTTLDVGDTGVLGLYWNSGGTDSPGNCIVVSTEKSGELDGKVTTAITFAPTT